MSCSNLLRLPSYSATNLYFSHTLARRTRRKPGFQADSFNIIREFFFVVFKNDFGNPSDNFLVILNGFLHQSQQTLDITFSPQVRTNGSRPVVRSEDWHLEFE